ncbi:MAG: hypothetical protein QXN94_02775 [Thermofilaceae archaeon]
MGGKKRPTISQLEKRARREQEKSSKQQDASRGKPKITLSNEGRVTQASLDAIFKEISRATYITPYMLHSQYGLRISEAKRVLKALEEQGLLKLVSGNRRVKIYVPVAA